MKRLRRFVCSDKIVEMQKRWSERVRRKCYDKNIRMLKMPTNWKRSRNEREREEKDEGTAIVFIEFIYDGMCNI